MQPTLIRSPDVWMEGSALLQLDKLAAQPGCRRVVGMPDLHAGQHGPIGVAALFDDGPYPALIGGDMGCGARLVGLPAVKAGGLDALERRVRAATEETLDVDPEALFSAAWRQGPRGLCALEGVPDGLREIAALDREDVGESGPLPEGAFGPTLGTIGGGNHFLELGEVESVRDRAVARAAGLVPGGLAVLAHSGSRSLGTALAARAPAGPLVGDTCDTWLADLRGAIRYARTNRLLLIWKLLRALSATRVSKIGGMFDVVHNTVVPQEGAWLHRKGCAPANDGELTLVLGSRGAHSWVMEGLGCESALCSVAHGAGRKMTRSEAVAKVRAHHTRASLVRTPLGGRVICDDPTLLYEEHPDAYKAIGPVVDALEEHGAARRIAALRPMISIKR